MALVTAARVTVVFVAHELGAVSAVEALVFAPEELKNILEKHCFRHDF